MYEYTYHEMKMIVDGEFVISDETGQRVTGRRGDVFYFPRGSRITFETATFGVGFFVGQRMVRASYPPPPPLSHTVSRFLTPSSSSSSSRRRVLLRLGGACGGVSGRSCALLAENGM